MGKKKKKNTMSAVLMVQTNVPVADVPLCGFNRAFTLHQVFAFDIMTVQTQLSAFSLQHWANKSAFEASTATHRLLAFKQKKVTSLFMHLL